MGIKANQLVKLAAERLASTPALPDGRDSPETHLLDKSLTPYRIERSWDASQPPPSALINCTLAVICCMRKLTAVR